MVASPTVEPADRTEQVGPAPRRLDLLLALATVAAIVPVVVAAVVAITNEWTALGDNAQVLLRSRDVFTEHTPLVGARSSSDAAIDFAYNTPGPLLYYLFAVPVRLWEDAGLVVAVAATTIASIIGIAYVLRRAGGAAVGLVGVLAVTGLGWSMGRPLLVDSWQPHSLLHPFLLFVVLAWATAAGDQRLLPWTAGVATLLVQSHLTYAYLVPALSIAAVGGLLAGAVRARRRDPDGWPPLQHALMRSGVVATIVLVLLWLPPLVEQVTASGRGNLARLLDAARAGTPTVGADAGIRRSAAVLAAWPTWLRPSLEWRAVAPAPFVSGIGFTVVVAILALAGWWAWRRRDRFGATGVVLALIAAIAATYSATATIMTFFGLGYHHVLYLWPVAILLQLALVAVVVRSLGTVASWRAAVVVTVLVVALAGANLGDVDRSRFGPAVVDDLAPLVRELRSQLDPLEDRGTLLLSPESGSFIEPYTHGLAAELGRRGVEFVVVNPVMIRRYGETREYEGVADAVVFLRWGPEALADEPGAERVAFVSSLDDAELDTWHRLRAEIVAAVESGGLELTSEGRRAIAEGYHDLPVDGDHLRIDDARAFVESRTFARAIDLGWVSVRGVRSSTLEEWASLNQQLLRSAAAVWVIDREDWLGA